MATKLQDLPLEERLKLVEDLWDSIAAEADKVPMNEAQRQLLDERLDQYELDGESGEPAHVVIDRIRRNSVSLTVNVRPPAQRDIEEAAR